MALARKTVLITGCTAGGIGGGLAEVFLERGYHVFATLRTPSKVSPVLAKSPDATVLALDVLQADSIAAAVGSVTSKTGGTLDVLVNNSGTAIIGPFLDMPLETGQALFQLNFWAPLAVIQAFAPLLIAAKGCIVNNTSANAVIPMPLMSMYGASKAAFANASEALRHELQPLGVRVATLITLAVKTNFGDRKLAIEIPASSHYYSVRDFITSLEDGRMQNGGLTPKQYANKVVSDVDRGATGEIWAGGGAASAKIGWWLSPQYVRDMLVQSIIPLTKEMTKASPKNV